MCCVPRSRKGAGPRFVVGWINDLRCVSAASLLAGIIQDLFALVLYVFPTTLRATITRHREPFQRCETILSLLVKTTPTTIKKRRRRKEDVTRRKLSTEYCECEFRGLSVLGACVKDGLIRFTARLSCCKGNYKLVPVLWIAQRLFWGCSRLKRLMQCSKHANQATVNVVQLK